MLVRYQAKPHASDETRRGKWSEWRQGALMSGRLTLMRAQPARRPKVAFGGVAAGILASNPRCTAPQTHGVDFAQLRCSTTTGRDSKPMAGLRMDNAARSLSEELDVARRFAGVYQGKTTLDRSTIVPGGSPLTGLWRTARSAGPRGLERHLRTQKQSS